ncbi:hypothetical protein WJX72_011154 [[Myrmecia] bisecta]|uniref:peptidylprolyl isomerase n=1 Tax=[Myrmecia] bisecta TaxID=41462 RepID=A0AAW1PYE7_9CHLO
MKQQYPGAPARPSQRTCRASSREQSSSDTSSPASEAQNSSPAAQPDASDQGNSASQETADLERQRSSQRRSAGRQADSTDWISSQLTRRFGIAGGLAWLGFLTFGVVGEQVKTRLEFAAEKSGTKEVANAKEVTTASGLRYTDLKIGGGAPMQRGFLVVLDFKGYANGEVFEDTKKRGKPVVFIYGSRPFTAGLCKGLEEALATMKSGGKRRVIVPPEMGFGNDGFDLRPTGHVPGKSGAVPPGATLTYELELLRVSIPPS